MESEKSEVVENILHEAAKRGNVELLRESLANRVSINSLDKARVCCMLMRSHTWQSGSTALHWAARCGHAECVALLLADPAVHMDVQNKLGDTPLHGAAWKNARDVVEMLLEKGLPLPSSFFYLTYNHPLRCVSEHQERRGPAAV